MHAYWNTQEGARQLPKWVIILDWFTFVWLVGWAVRALLDISSDRRRSVSFVVLVFVAFYGALLADR